MARLFDSDAKYQFFGRNYQANGQRAADFSANPLIEALNRACEAALIRAWEIGWFLEHQNMPWRYHSIALTIDG
jgi:hypothetical protein